MINACHRFVPPWVIRTLKSDQMHVLRGNAELLPQIFDQTPLLGALTRSADHSPLSCFRSPNMDVSRRTFTTTTDPLQNSVLDDITDRLSIIYSSSLTLYACFDSREWRRTNLAPTDLARQSSKLACADVIAKPSASRAFTSVRHLPKAGLPW